MRLLAVPMVISQSAALILQSNVKFKMSNFTLTPITIMSERLSHTRLLPKLPMLLFRLDLLPKPETLKESRPTT